MRKFIIGSVIVVACLCFAILVNMSVQLYNPIGIVVFNICQAIAFLACVRTLMKTFRWYDRNKFLREAKIK